MGIYIYYQCEMVLAGIATHKHLYRILGNAGKFREIQEIKT